MMRYLGMLPGPVELVKAPVWLTRYEVLTSPATGAFKAVVEPGTTVSAGALVGYVSDLLGNRIAEITAPFDGEVMYVIRHAGHERGEPVG